jgi:beta-glucuronidase
LWDVRAAYLYDFDVKIDEDHYTLPIGIRTVRMTDKQFLVNGKPVYLKGFGKHEDSDIRGKGLDDALNVRDFELLKWMGANSFRTSHYPYSEEIMQMADRQGFLVIDEVPAVGMNFWSSTPVFEEGSADETTLQHHKDVLTELYERDKNHPCVVMWNVSNEAQTKDKNALSYFSDVVSCIRALDDTRPIVNVIDEGNVNIDTVSHLFDAICLNRYYSWYYDLANLKSIYPKLTADFKAYHEKYNKPVMISEYGTDTIAGLHKLPDVIFSEEYQIEFYKENNRALDDLDFIIGEHLWAFADFATSFGLRRFDGNKKGIFTRQRQPKSAAFVIRERWTHK